MIGLYTNNTVYSVRKKSILHYLHYIYAFLFCYLLSWFFPLLLPQYSWIKYHLLSLCNCICILSVLFGLIKMFILIGHNGLYSLFFQLSTALFFFVWWSSLNCFCVSDVLCYTAKKQCNNNATVHCTKQNITICIYTVYVSI